MKWINKFFKNDNLLPEDEEFVADSKAALLNKQNPYARMILYSILIFMLLMLVVAGFSTINQMTVAEGKIIPATEVKKIQSLDGGIVANIFVKEGQVVQKNQSLIRLDETRYTAEYKNGYSKYLALSAIVARLTAEANGYNQVDFPVDVKRDQPDLLARENNHFLTHKAALNQTLTELQQQFDLANKEVEMYQPLLEKGIVSKRDYLRSQRSVSEIQSKILEAKNEYSQTAWAELNKNKADLLSLSEQLAALKDKMLRTTLYSSVYGVVKKINIKTIGGVVQPGADIMEVVPLEDTLLVQAYVRPADIAFIHVGQPATVRITAYDYSIYGNLKGKVEYISADSIQPETNMPNEDKATANQKSYYIVNIRTDRNYLGSEKHRLPISAGMMATVNIVTGEKTLLDYLLKPLVKAKEEALRER